MQRKLFARVEAKFDFNYERKTLTELMIRKKEVVVND